MVKLATKKKEKNHITPQTNKGLNQDEDLAKQFQFFTFMMLLDDLNNPEVEWVVSLKQVGEAAINALSNAAEGAKEAAENAAEVAGDVAEAVGELLDGIDL